MYASDQMFESTDVKKGFHGNIGFYVNIGFFLFQPVTENRAFTFSNSKNKRKKFVLYLYQFIMCKRFVTVHSTNPTKRLSFSLKR